MSDHATEAGAAERAPDEAPKRRGKKAAEGGETAAERPRPYPDPQNINQAKLNVMAAVPYLLKSRRAGSGPYSYMYAGEAEMIRHVRPAMLLNAIDVCPVAAELVDGTGYQGSKQAMRAARVRMTYEFTHVPSGTKQTVQMIGEGADIGDKAAGKANTAAYKWAIRQWLCIETGDDPDRVASEDLAAANGQTDRADPGGKVKADKAAPVDNAVAAVNRATSYAALKSLVDRAAEHFGDKTPEYQRVLAAARKKKAALEKAAKAKEADKPADDFGPADDGEPNF
jgi:hypothetical protein